jgi:hypothetical protein
VNTHDYKDVMEIAHAIGIEEAVKGIKRGDAWRAAIPDLKERIRVFVLSYDHCSFVEIMEIAGPEHKGDAEIYKGDPNLIMWAGVSEELARAITSLELEGQIEIRPCETYVGPKSQNPLPLVYLTDGGLLRLPVAKHPLVGDKVRKYKTPHWLPCVLSRPKAGPGKGLRRRDAGK